MRQNPTPDDLYRGCLVTWLHVPRGGYGFTLPVEAKVLVVHSRDGKATIEIAKADGSLVSRRVAVTALRWRSP